MVDEQRPDASDEQPERYVNEPMDAEVENGEDEQQGVEQNEQVVGPVTPFPQGPTLFFDMQVIEHQNPERNGDVQTWNSIVERVMERIEHRVPSFMVEQRIHSWNP